MRILIAEGERYQADMLVRLLKHTGYTTDVVSDGQSCIEWAATGIYDVLILDMKIRGQTALPCRKPCAPKITTYRF